MSFHEINQNGRYDTILKNGSKFLKGLQDDAADPKDPNSGGVAENWSGRPG